MVSFTELGNAGEDVSFMEEIKNAFLDMLKVAPGILDRGILHSEICLRMKLHNWDSVACR